MSFVTWHNDIVVTCKVRILTQLVLHADQQQHPTVNQVNQHEGGPAVSYQPDDFDMDDSADFDWRQEHDQFNWSRNGQVGDTTALGLLSGSSEAANLASTREVVDQTHAAKVQT